MTDKRRHRSTTTALTLVELLVVITILVIVAGVVLPLAQPALKQSAVREASREVQTFLEGARARAIATQQPVGVRFELQNIELAPAARVHTNDTAFALSQVKMSTSVFVEALGPSPLRGASFGSVQLTMANWERLKTAYQQRNNDQRGLLQIGNDPRFFRLPNEVLGPQGAFLEVPPSSDIPRGALLVQFGPPDGNCNDASYLGGFLGPSVVRGTPIRLFLEPIRPRFSVGGRVELPVGTYVDISWSGVGLNGKFFDDGATGLTLVFGPSGQLEWLYGHVDFPFATATTPGPFVLSGDPYGGSGSSKSRDRCGPYVPESPIHLLIGRQKRGANIDPYINLRPDSGSLWVSVNHRTGVISTSDNLGSSIQVTNDADLVALVEESRASVNVALDAGG